MLLMLPNLRNSAIHPYLAALLLSIIAACMQWLIHPLVSSRIPFLFFQPSLVLAALFLGTRPASIVFLSGALNALFLMPPRGELGINESSDQFALAGYIFVGIFLMAIAHIVRRKMQSRTEALHDSLIRLQQEIDERKLMEQQLQAAHHQLETRVAERTAELLRAKQEAEQASRAKSDFLSRTSHELRTPLNSILILSELLVTSPDMKPADIKMASTIREAGQDLLELMNDLLDLAQIESGVGLMLEKSAVKWPVLQKFLSNIFEETAKRKKLQFNIVLDPDLPPVFHSDEKRLMQILKNLLANAFKFTNEGSVTLSISIAKTGWGSGYVLLDEAGQALLFAVSDTGIGIPEDKLELIFEAFQQVDGSITRKYGGTGLGLSISRELALRMGGSIRLRSDVNKGSIFELYLPLPPTKTLPV